ncbi:pancreatic lipase-related protein 2 isoform 2-T2 [Glossina fuscipes fuscipes]
MKADHKLMVFLFIISILNFAAQYAAAQAKNDSSQIYVTESCLEKPFRCPHPKIQFYLYTRRTQDEPEYLNVLDDNSLYYTHFNPRHPTKIIIHGFGGGRNLSPSPDLRQAYFTIGDHNIIIVDYSTAVREPCLSQMEWAPRFGGLCISQLIKYLARHPRGVQPIDLHLIGYSVGAHIAGLVANYLRPDGAKMGRITALDPTIFFYAGSNNSKDLDPSDANFVDVLHTGAGILGQWHTSGHADFYVNGETLACDHTKVTPYFIESITTKKGFYAGPCPNLFTYLIGWCEPKDSEYVLMGEHVSHKARGTYYVTTNAKPPYARGFPGKARSAGEYRGVRR